ncbi:MAG: hypothetical protein PHV34_13025 [Verrucomicrobiae bacterium]|nr:hypothetical protein [Verrucomicrobiae bacterium]
MNSVKLWCRWFFFCAALWGFSGCGSKEKIFPPKQQVEDAVRAALPSFLILDCMEFEVLGAEQESPKINFKAVVVPKADLFRVDQILPGMPEVTLLKPVQKAGAKITLYGSIVSHRTVDLWSFEMPDFSSGLQQCGQPRGSFGPQAFETGTPEADIALRQQSVNVAQQKNLRKTEAENVVRARIPSFLNPVSMETEVVDAGRETAKVNFRTLVVAEEDLFQIDQKISGMPEVILLKPVQKAGSKISLYGFIVARRTLNQWDFEEPDFFGGLQKCGQPRGSFGEQSFVAGTPDAEAALKRQAERAAQQERARKNEVEVIVRAAIPAFLSFGGLETEAADAGQERLKINFKVVVAAREDLFLAERRIPGKSAVLLKLAQKAGARTTLCGSIAARRAPDQWNFEKPVFPGGFQQCGQPRGSFGARSFIAGTPEAQEALKTQPSEDSQPKKTVDKTLKEMEALGLEAAKGSREAVDQLEQAAGEIYGNLDYHDTKSTASKLALMRAAFAPLAKRAGEGAPEAMDALKYANSKGRLRPFTSDAFGIAAGMGNAEALEKLLHHGQNGWCAACASSALQYAAEKNIPGAVDFLVQVLSESKNKLARRYASRGLVGAAALGNEKAGEALKKYDEEKDER